MNRIRLDASRWSAEQDFYNDLLPAVGAPDWHGQNLDALWDALVGGDIWTITPPLTVEVSGCAGSALERSGFLAKVAVAFSEAREEGFDYSLLLR